MLDTRNLVSRDEILAAIKELVVKLERRPTLRELADFLKMSEGRVGRLFGSYSKALKASGVVGVNALRLTMEQLLEDWRHVVRRLGKMPTVEEYRRESRYSERPLSERFVSWNNIPAGMLEFGDRKELWAGWEDVRELTQRCVDKQPRLTSMQGGGRKPILAEVDVNLLYGGPLVDSPMVIAPNNEMGVVLLFGAMARKLGFAVLKLQPTDFPDCEAFREVAANRWKRVRIEFEFESRNFVTHGHDPQECDLIVCWEHNWKECTLDVVELRGAVVST